MHSTEFFQTHESLRRNCTLAQPSFKIYKISKTFPITEIDLQWYYDYPANDLVNIKHFTI